jgi:hypothetical protein
MSKALTEAQVTTAKARSRLELGVHWRRLDAEAHLGYRKGKQSGVWFVRWRNHHEGGRPLNPTSRNATLEKDAEQVATSDPTPVLSCGATFLVKKSAVIRKLRKLLLSHRCICMP